MFRFLFISKSEDLLKIVELYPEKFDNRSYLYRRSFI